MEEQGEGRTEEFRWGKERLEKALEDEVAGVTHAERLVSGPSGGVVLFDVETHAGGAFGASGGDDVFVEGAEDAAAAEVGTHVDALNPPEGAVAPVAPFVGDHQLADDGAWFGGICGSGHEVTALGRV